MNERFSYDVFLSYSPKDIAPVREIAERLRADGIKVWFDEWSLKPGEDVSDQIEYGLEKSRVLVLCMSGNAYGSELSKLERQSFRFRDPLNQERRFVPLRLDKTEPRGFLEQYIYVDWAKGDREQEYKSLLDTCRPPAKPPAAKAAPNSRHNAFRTIEVESKSDETVLSYSFNPDGKSVLTVTSVVQLWDLETLQCVSTLKGHSSTIWSVDWSRDKCYAVSCSADRTARIWDLRTATCLQVLTGHSGSVQCAVWSPDQRLILTGSDDDTMRLWDAKTGRCRRVFEGHTEEIWSVAWSLDQRQAVSGSADGSLRLWDLKTARCLRVFEGHQDYVRHVAWNSERGQVLSGSDDETVRLWDIDTGRCLSVFEGHKAWVLSVAWHPTRALALSGSYDRTLRLWNTETGRCLRILKHDLGGVETAAWSADGHYAFSGDSTLGILVWDMTRVLARIPVAKTTTASVSAPDQVQYTNAKVLLVGESGVGKTGLSKVLAGQKWKPSDSTIGAWATQWKLEVSPDKDVEREIWLWDFGGQADQRLIHQLYMDETALAVLVFDGQKDDLFETLGQWDRDLTRASRRKDFAKLLVAGRVDAGGLRVSRTEIEKFSAERKFRGFIETSAKRNLGCDELRKAILTSIDWNEIPCRTTEVLFKKLKEEIIRLKDEDRVLMRFNELREALQRRLPNAFKQFSDKELRAVLTLLRGPCVVWELDFGNWVLLQPERINAYAQAVIRTLQGDKHQRGCLMEELVLKGELDYESSMPRLSGEDERFVLLAMHQLLVERGLCLRQPTSQGNLLVFPSYYRRERTEQLKSPAIQVNYRFTGFLDEIYATLVVRLHHSDSFDQDQLWRDAADFKTKTGKQLGVKLTRRAPGVGDLEVYFDPTVATEEKIIFSKYVHEHLLQHAKDVERLRHYVCGNCGTPVGNREVAMQRLNQWLRGRPPETARRLKVSQRKDETPTIICVGCEDRVALWDAMEQCFASAEIQQRVREMQEEAAIVLSNQSKERVLVGEVISTVALANQISREFSVSDHGIDMEIEFTDDNHEATGAKIYLQLKSGDSYLRKQKKNGAEVFTIKNERHVRYWMAQGFPVLLVIRNSEGEVRWMEVRDWLKRESDNGKKDVKRIVFDGERFDVMSVLRWRDRCLGV